jgi:SAM-dependent methyltransferase
MSTYVEDDDAVAAWEDIRLTCLARLQGEPRSARQLREHYAVERELADRLRSAPRRERAGLYSEVYDELFRRLPHHPQLQAAGLPHDDRETDRLLGLLRRYFTPATVFMEIGPGDCALSIRVAALVRQVYAVDVSEHITRGEQRPANFTLMLSDGCSTGVADGAVDVAFSNQLMEHLHPDDATEQLQNIHRSLAPGGLYVCLTPNRLYGPHDISSLFDDVATGFHLREYTARDLNSLFRRAGFRDVSFYAVAAGRVARCPYWLLAACEGALELLPRRLARRLADTRLLRAVLGICAVARR